MKVLFFSIIACCLFFSLKLNAQDKFEVKTSHPRVVLSKEAELSMRFLFLDNKDANEIQVSLRSTADKLAGETFNLEDTKGNITKERSKELLYKVTTLGMAFRIFEEEKYANKIVEYLVEVAQLSDWIAKDPLIGADLITISAIGYDWLFYDLSFEVREQVRNSIVRKGLYPGLEMMKTSSEEENWLSQNPQCELTFSNSLVLGSLAVADDFPDLNKKVIYQFLVSNQQKLEALEFEKFKTDNIDTWQSEVNFLAMGLASIKLSLGHDFNISSLPNIKNFSTEYLLYTQAQVSESDELSVLDPSLLWFGKLNDQVDANSVYMGNVKKYHLNSGENERLNYICLLWMI